MAQFWRASSVTVTNGSPFISVQTGDDVALIRPNAILQIEEGQFAEVKTVNTSASPQTIELMESWGGGSGAGRSAIAANVGAPRIDALIATANNLIDVYEQVVNDISVPVSGDSIPRRTSNGRIKVANGTDSDDAVAYGQLDGVVEDFTEQVDLQLARVNAEQKLKDNAVVYLDFANNEGKEASDFTINRATATDLINYTAPDGVSVQTADGRIVFAPANTAAIGWNNGECVGLVSAPASTNLLLNSDEIATQTASVSNALHSISFYGTGSVTLSGAFEGTLSGESSTKRATLTFTPNAGDLVITPSGSVNFAQLEQGYPTPYTKTEASQVTRGVVFFDLSGKSISPEKITVLIEFTPESVGTLGTGGLFEMHPIGGDGSSGYDVRIINQMGRLGWFGAGGVIPGMPASAVVLMGELNRLAFVVDGNDYHLYLNGNKIVSSLSVDPSLKPASIGDIEILRHDRSDGRTMNGTCPLFSVANTTFIDAEAIALTTLEDSQ